MKYVFFNAVLDKGIFLNLNLAKYSGHPDQNSFCNENRLKLAEILNFKDAPT